MSFLDDFFKFMIHVCLSLDTEAYQIFSSIIKKLELALFMPRLFVNTMNCITDMDDEFMLKLSIAQHAHETFFFTYN